MKAIIIYFYPGRPVAKITIPIDHMRGNWGELHFTALLENATKDILVKQGYITSDVNILSLEIIDNQ